MNVRRIRIIESDQDIAQSVSEIARFCGYDPQHYFELQGLLNDLHPEAESLVLLGECNPSIGAAAALDQILKRAPFVKVVVLGLESKPMELVRAIKGGAADALELPFTIDRFKSVLQEAKAYLPVQPLAVTATETKSNSPKLLPDELTMLEYFSQGLTVKQIAARMDVSVRTIHYRKSAVFKKIGASNRTEAMLKFSELKSHSSVPGDPSLKFHTARQQVQPPHLSEPSWSSAFHSMDLQDHHRAS